MSLLTTNSKLRADKIKTFSLPPIKTCPFAGECKKYCYARKGCYNFPNVGKALEMRRKLTLDHYDFIQTMDRELMKTRARFIRIHSAGDFYSKRYLQAWYTLARLHPNKIFYAYTKSIAWCKETSEARPENMRLIFSYGSKQDHLINPETDYHAVIFRDSMPPEYTNGSDSDLIAAVGTNKKIGLLIH